MTEQSESHENQRCVGTETFQEWNNALFSLFSLMDDSTSWTLLEWMMENMENPFQKMHHLFPIFHLAYAKRAQMVHNVSFIYGRIKLHALQWKGHHLQAGSFRNSLRTMDHKFSLSSLSTEAQNLHLQFPVIFINTFLKERIFFPLPNPECWFDNPKVILPTYTPFFALENSSWITATTPMEELRCCKHVRQVNVWSCLLLSQTVVWYSPYFLFQPAVAPQRLGQRDANYSPLGSSTRKACSLSLSP